ncbi:MAG: hypothetical protein DI566_05090 [Microbacterium sp.]|nr:MAG: hypothetical protein DI566_05090 [Microbacterium sp.]
MTRREGPRPAPRLGHWARDEYRRLKAAEGMPAATHTAVRVEQDLVVTADDGTALLTDHWFAEGAGDTVVLIRTPYGRRSGGAMARFLAERGHHVVVSSCRGTFGSGGVFDPLHHEASDGQAVLRWLRAQPWAGGMVQSFGFSYVGLTQWALCEGPERPDAMVIGVSSRDFSRSIVYPGGGFAMETGVVWCYALDFQERPPIVGLYRLLRARPRVAKASLAVPPEDAVLTATGHRMSFFEDWLAHSPDDPWWQPLRFAEQPGTPPITLLAGWQDLFLTGGFADYATLRDRGDDVRIIAGDWTHHGPDAGVVAVRELLRGFGAQAEAEPRVRVEIAGGGGWRNLPDWPPAHEDAVWHLAPAGALAPEASAHESSAGYRYDPADPTPQAGGRSLNPFVSGRRDQAPRENRDDVLVFTSSPLEAELTVIGDAEVELSFTSTSPAVDFFLRLCDVDEAGVSHTVTDVFQRMPGANGRREVRLRLSPTAYRFAAGHRLRLQVSSGAHPLHLRNPGTADPVHDFSRLVPSEQTIFLGGAAPSALHLPVVPGSSAEAT